MTKRAVIGGAICLGLLGGAIAWLRLDTSQSHGLVGNLVAQSQLLQVLIGGVMLAMMFGAAFLWAWVSLLRLKGQRGREHKIVEMALNHLDHGVVITNPARSVLYANDYYLELYGLTREKVIRGITGPELLDLRRAKGSMPITTDEFYARAAEPDGIVFELDDGRLMNIKRWQLPDGSAISTHHDCTEQSRLSREVSTTKSFLESVIDNVPVCIAAKSIEDGRYILANRAFEVFSRFPRERLVGKRADELFTPATAAAIEAADRKAIDQDGYRDDMIVERGSKKRILAGNRVIARDERGQPEYLIALFEDITDIKSLSDEVKAAKQFLKTVVDNIPVSLIVQSAEDGRYLLANRNAEAVLNRRREDAMGLTTGDIFNEKEARLITARDQAALRSRGIVIEEHPISTKDGLRLFLTRRATVLDEQGNPTIPDQDP